MFFRGVNFTAEHGARYGSPESIEQLKKLPAYGVDSIALVPYAGMRRGSSTLRWSDMSLEPAEGVAALVAAARALGIKTMIKPQVWVPGGFTGDIAFTSAVEANAWFTSYSAYVLHFAALASQTKCDLFCIGNEFGKLREQPFWTTLIAQVRKVFRGPLTYAATQGEEFEQIRFWDRLDFIGLNNYYPLPDSLDCSVVAGKVEAVAKRFRRPILLTECGFASLSAPHRQPWDETRRAISLEDQARCYEATFRAFYRHPDVRGMFWWKVGTNGFGGPSDGSHTPWNKPAMQVVSHWYHLR